MFTGIIKELGTVKSIARKGLSIEISVQSGLAKDLKPGDSIAINGVCLTATKTNGDEFRVDAVAETLNKTTLGALHTNEKVNLESALAAGQPMGGHIVNGHVDGVAIIRGKINKGDGFIFEFSLPSEIRGLSKYIVDKGPVAVDGISLTVVEARSYAFTVSVIPFTIENTTLGFKKVGEKVNLEVDIMAKYAEKTGRGSIY